MSSKSKRRLFILAPWVLVVAAGVAPRPAASKQGPLKLAEKARSILQQRCFQCHGENGKAAKGIFLLDYARLIASQFVVPGDVNSRLMAAVESGAMPPGGTGLSVEEKAFLRNWIVQGAPGWSQPDRAEEPRRFLTEPELVAWVRRDMEQAPARRRSFLRYFSLAHFYNAGLPEDEMESHRAALSKLLNSLSWRREITPPAAIDPARTLFRIDLRDYDWAAATWQAIVAAYPYGLVSPHGDAIASALGGLPYMRADWFVTRASEPPLYHDLLGLPQTIAELERRLGVETARNLAEEKGVLRGGVRASGVSQNNRVLERHSFAFGAYWRSYDFRNNVGDQNIFADPLRLSAAGGEIIFNLPNGLQGYFLADARGRRIDAAPIEIVSDRNQPDDPVVRNGRSCMSCHFGGMKHFEDDVRTTLLGSIRTAFSAEQALALYAPQEQVNRALAEDSARFREAEALTGARAATNATAEPVGALARRFQSDLSLALAAAEVGLEARDFLERVRWNARLNARGLGQLLEANGGFKRDAWERHFEEIVRELQPGLRLAVRTNQPARAAWSGAASNALLATNSANRPAGAVLADASDLLRGARSLTIRSGTVYLRPELLEAALQKQPIFQSLGIAIVKEMDAADLLIDLNRPLFTFDFTYSVSHRQSSQALFSGKVVAFDGNAAAPKIAKELIRRMPER
jgi:mono/diheme cytochrome c family protein